MSLVSKQKDDVIRDKIIQIANLGPQPQSSMYRSLSSSSLKARHSDADGA